jgi:hypothetical protein
MSQIKFGTDGWRAVIAEDFTFSNLERVAQATADFWAAMNLEGAQPRFSPETNFRLSWPQNRRPRPRSHLPSGSNMPSAA